MSSFKKTVGLAIILAYLMVMVPGVILPSQAMASSAPSTVPAVQAPSVTDTVTADKPGLSSESKVVPLRRDHHRCENVRQHCYRECRHHHHDKHRCIERCMHRNHCR